ncbi:MAG: methyltransferase domain-containing protein, partial [Thermoplasmata archaeon]|nr:methyltransferase domain-containing protein [Thermoplasmata archaeon]
SYPHRGDWATHKGDYRGNWPPQMVRNILLRYSKKGDVVLDQMVGSGTTLIECKLLGRNGIGVDINKNCIMLTRDRLNFRYTTLDYDSEETFQKTYVGDARNLNLIKNNSIDLIATHPPYANIIPYSKEKIEGDLSNEYSIDEFVTDMEKVAKESFRVLKPNHYCAILIGDTRRKKHHVPIAFRVMQTFLDAGFILKEDVIKHQWRCKSTPFWLKRSIEYNFLLLMHEHLFVFRKPDKGEDLEEYADSIKWW